MFHSNDCILMLFLQKFRKSELGTRRIKKNKVPSILLGANIGTSYREHHTYNTYPSIIMYINIRMIIFY